MLVADPDATALFEATRAAAPELEAKPVANWVTGEYLRLRNATDGPVGRGGPRSSAAIVVAATSGAISRAQAREVLEAHATTGASAASIIAERGLPPDLGHAAS